MAFDVEPNTRGAFRPLVTKRASLPEKGCNMLAAEVVKNSRLDLHRALVHPETSLLSSPLLTNIHMGVGLVPRGNSLRIAVDF